MEIATGLLVGSVRGVRRVIKTEMKSSSGKVNAGFVAVSYLRDTFG